MTDPMDGEIEIPLAFLLEGLVPEEWVESLDEVADWIYWRPSESKVEWDGDLFMSHVLVIRPPEDDEGEAPQDGPLVLPLGLADGAALVIGDGRALEVSISVWTAPSWRVRVAHLSLGLKLPPGVLQEAELRDGVFVPKAGVEGALLSFEGGFEIRKAGGVFAAPIAVTLPPVLIGGAPLALELGTAIDPGTPGASIIVGRPPAELAERLPMGWRGLWIGSATAHFQEVGTRFEVSAVDAMIGTGGFSGTLAFGAPEDRATFRDWSREQIEVRAGTHGRLLNGSSAFLVWGGIDFNDGSPDGGEMIGYVRLPLIEKWVGFRLALGGPDCKLLIELSGGGEPVVSLETDWLEISADRVSYELRGDEHWAVIAGKIRPRFGGIDWPWFRVDRLAISASGDVDLPGGWLKLPEKSIIDFGVARVEVTGIGFGSDRESRWVGVTGDVRLIDGVPLTASVKGLTIRARRGNLADFKVSLEALGVELTVPGALRVHGEVDHETLSPGEEDDASIAAHVSGSLFRGEVGLDVLPVKFSVDASFLAGRLRHPDAGDFAALMVVVDLNLPVSIPLGASGCGLYGMAGLFAMNTAPDRRERDWWSWYVVSSSVVAGDAYSASSIYKWSPRPGALGVGAGVTLGTIFDAGFVITGGLLLAVSLPGPVVLLEGRARVLAPPLGRDPSQAARSATYRAAVIVDGPAGTIQAAVATEYSIPFLIEISGTLEAFFDLGSFDRWYVHLGAKEPRSKRISSKLLSILESQSYLEISPAEISVGSLWGYNLRKKIGPVKITLVATAELEASLSWKPIQIRTSVEIQVAVGLKVFGIGLELGLEIGAEIAAPRPYHLAMHIAFSVGLPWPLPDQDIEFELSWTSSEEHDLPPYISGSAIVHHRVPSLDLELAGNSILVPPDSRIEVRFERPLSLTDAREPDQWPAIIPEYVEKIGDKTVRYAVQRIELYEQDQGGGWSRLRWFDDTAGIDPEDAFDRDGRTALLPWATDNPPIEPRALPSTVLQSPRWQLWQHSVLDRGDPARALPPPTRSELTDRWRRIAWGKENLGSVPLTFTIEGVRFLRQPGLAAVMSEQGSLVLEFGQWIVLSLPSPAAEVELNMLRVNSRVFVFCTRSGRTTPVVATDSPDGTVRVVSNEPEGFDEVRIEWTSTPSPVALVSHAKLIAISWLGVARDIRPPSAAPVGPGAGGRTPLLLPGTNYRFDLTWSRSVDGGEPSLHRASSPFRTLFGPGASSEADEARFVEKGWTLSNYLRSTFPVDGTRHTYPGDDVYVTFAEPYIRNMYPAEKGLCIRVVDRSERPLGDPQIDSWAASATPLISDGDVLAQRSGLTIQNLVYAPQLWARLPEGRRVGERLGVEVWTRPLLARPGARALHRFHVSISRFLNVEAHLASFAKPARRVKRLFAKESLPPSTFTKRLAARIKLAFARRALSAAATPIDVTRAALSVESASVENENCRKSLLVDFEDWLKTVYDGQMTLERPEGGGELIALQVRGRPGFSVILAQSIEPLDWSHVRLQLTADGFTGDVDAVPADDQASAFLFLPDASNGRPRELVLDSLRISWSFDAQHAPEQDHPTRFGVPVRVAGNWVLPV